MGNGMDKDAYWFPHDANAKRDPKVMLLRHELGAEGYGLYWMLVEDLRDQSNYCLPVRLLPALAKEYGTTETKLDAVVKGYGLFDIKDDAIFYSPSLIRRMQIWDRKKLAAKERAEKAAKARWNRALGAGKDDAQAEPKQCTSNAQALQEQCTSNADAMQSDAITEHNKHNRTNITEQTEQTQQYVEAMCVYFGVDEVNDFGKYRSITQFINLLATTGQLGRFRKQFPAYIQFKEKSGEKRHRLGSFMGDPKNQCQDGGWNAANWVEELKTLPAESSADMLSQMKNI